MQEYLNRVRDAPVGDPDQRPALRLLRDSTALAGSAYVEFDLETIFDGELYPEFLLFWQLATSPGWRSAAGRGAAVDCWLEAWRGEAVEAGTRALDKLRDGVETALTRWAPASSPPDERLAARRPARRRAHRPGLPQGPAALVYRLLFCFVAEDRGALLDPDGIRRGPRPLRRRTSPPRGCAGCPAAAPADRTPTCGSPADRPGALWAARDARRLGVPALGGLFDPDSRAPHVDRPAPRSTCCWAPSSPTPTC